MAPVLPRGSPGVPGLPVVAQPLRTHEGCARIRPLSGRGVVHSSEVHHGSALRSVRQGCLRGWQLQPFPRAIASALPAEPPAGTRGHRRCCPAGQRVHGLPQVSQGGSRGLGAQGSLAAASRSRCCQTPPRSRPPQTRSGCRRSGTVPRHVLPAAGAGRSPHAQGQSRPW